MITEEKSKLMKLYKKREILFIYLLHIKIINSFNKNQLLTPNSNISIVINYKDRLS